MIDDFDVNYENGDDDELENEINDVENKILIINNEIFEIFISNEKNNDIVLPNDETTI